MDERLMAAGTHSAQIDGRDDADRPLASGVYYYRVESVEGTVSGRVVVLK
jgi:hypothetical protein